jgi:hypothetical protein
MLKRALVSEVQIPRGRAHGSGDRDRMRIRLRASPRLTTRAPSLVAEVDFEVCSQISGAKQANVSDREDGSREAGRGPGGPDQKNREGKKEKNFSSGRVATVAW